jgi:hypothetical protein
MPDGFDNIAEKWPPFDSGLFIGMVQFFGNKKERRTQNKQNADRHKCQGRRL